MGRLGEPYDSEELVTWHHFAYRADVERLRELRVALERWITLRERAPLEAYWCAYRDDWDREAATATIATERSWFEPLIEHAKLAGEKPAAVRARVDALGPRITRELHARVIEFPTRVQRLLALKASRAPKLLLTNERGLMRDTLMLEQRAFDEMGDGAAAVASSLDFATLFEGSLELAIREPWAERCGLGRLYGVIADELPRVATSGLVDLAWPVHFQNLDSQEPCTYGGGYAIALVESRTAADEIAAFEPSATLLRGFAIDRVIRQLENEGVDLTDDDDDLDFETQRRARAEQLAPARVQSSLTDVQGEWRDRKATLVAALRDVAAGRCVLVEWDAKHPVLC
jgi:hypothetical protein